jgi:hypothetical protein
MPNDTFVLPGIDAAPAAAPAATPDNSTSSATVDTGSAPAAAPANNDPNAPAPAHDPGQQPPADPKADDKGEQRRQSRGIQRRFDELTADNRATKALLDRTLGVLERFAPGQQQPGQAAEQPEPREQDFNSWQEYQRALTRWEARQAYLESTRADREAQQREQQQRATHQQTAQVQQAVETMHAHVATAMQQAAARYPDYVDTIEGATFDIPPTLEYAIATSDAPGDVCYYLAKNENVARQLARLAPVQAAHQIARIAAHMRAGPSISNAPAPGRPANTRGAAVNAYPENATPEQHKAWLERQNAGARAAR